MILFVQTFGDLANFNPRVHVLATDGAFRAGGTFAALPAIPQGLLTEGFRRAVLDFLVWQGAISEALRVKLLGWRHSGFSVHNEVRVAQDDAAGTTKLAGYMLARADRSKIHLGLKRKQITSAGAARPYQSPWHSPLRTSAVGLRRSRMRSQRRCYGCEGASATAHGAETSAPEDAHAS